METDYKVQIWLLGGIYAKKADGSELVFPTRKCASLLGYLACNIGKDSLRDDIAAFLWPLAKDGAGRNSLSVALSTLRKQFEPDGLGEPILQCDHRSVRLNQAAVWSDIDEFTRLIRQANYPENHATKLDMLHRALELYAGPFMRGDTEQWAALERFRIEQICLEVLCHVMDSCKLVPDTHRALNCANKILQWNPKSRDLLVRIERLRRRVNIEEEARYRKTRTAAEDRLRPVGAPRRDVSHFLVPKREISKGDLESLGGAVPLESAYYVERDADKDLFACLDQANSIVLIKGPRQIGKTSLLARGLDHARQAGVSVAMTDLQGLDEDCFESAEAFFKTLARALLEQLGVAIQLSDIWDTELGPAMNLERILRRDVFGSVQGKFVWALDEVDRVFGYDFSATFFGLLRSWHNKRALEPEAHWKRLTLAISYATEAQFFIQDINQSPFNVGTRLELKDFSVFQVADLNQRYGLPLKNSSEIEEFYRLVGGHPFLVRAGLNELKTEEMPYSVFAKNAALDEGPFGEHLRRILSLVEKNDDSRECLTSVLQGAPCRSPSAFHKLRAEGILKGETAKSGFIRCELYRNYLKGALLSLGQVG